MSDAYAKYSATASALGYFYQIRFALYLALENVRHSPNLAISIERFDDIAFDHNGEPLQHIQTKLHNDTAANLTDRSPDLWKTIRVWSEVAKDHPTTLLDNRFILVTNTTVPNDSACSFLRPTKELGRDESAALERLRDILTEKPSQANKKGFDAFQDLSATMQESLVSAIDILDESPGMTDTYELICDRLFYSAPGNRVKDLVAGVEGWWFQKAVTSLTGSPQSIRLGELEQHIDGLREQFLRDALPTHYEDYAPPTETINSYFGYTFVSQLDAIGMRPQSIAWAIRDYIRAFEERSNWVRKVYVYDDDMSKYENRLVEAWQPRFANLQDKASKLSDIEEQLDAAREAFQWIELEANLPFRSVTSRYLCVGSYHMLSDAIRIGWHPRYSELISGE